MQKRLLGADFHQTAVRARPHRRSRRLGSKLRFGAGVNGHDQSIRTRSVERFFAIGLVEALNQKRWSGLPVACMYNRDASGQHLAHSIEPFCARGVVWNRRAQFLEIPRHLAVCPQRSAALLATARRIQNGSGQPAGSDNDAICVINALGPTTQRQFSGKDGRRRWRGVQQYSPRSAPCRWSQM